MEFDLSYITTDVNRHIILDDVVLILRQNYAGWGPEYSKINVVLRRLGADPGSDYDFDESTVTWNSAPTEPGGTVGMYLTSNSFSPNIPIEGRWRIFRNTPLFALAVKQALSADDGTLRLLLLAPEEENPRVNDSSFATFDAESGPDPHNRPVLIVTYHLGLPDFSEVDKLPIWACLISPQLCSEQIVRTGHFQNIYCDEEELLCTHLLQAALILGQPDPPPIEAFFRHRFDGNRDRRK